MQWIRSGFIFYINRNLPYNIFSIFSSDRRHFDFVHPRASLDCHCLRFVLVLIVNDSQALFIRAINITVGRMRFSGIAIVPWTMLSVAWSYPSCWAAIMIIVIMRVSWLSWEFLFGSGWGNRGRGRGGKNKIQEQCKCCECDCPKWTICLPYVYALWVWRESKGWIWIWITERSNTSFFF